MKTRKILCIAFLLPLFAICYVLYQSRGYEESGYYHGDYDFRDYLPWSSAALRLSVMTYNVYMSSWDAYNRRPRLVRALSLFRNFTGHALPDLVLFQEGTWEFYQELNESQVFMEIAEGFNYWLMVASQHPILEIKTFDDLEWEKFSNATKPRHMYVKVSMNDSKGESHNVSLLNIHLTAEEITHKERIEDYKGFRDLTRSSMEIPPEEPFIVGGDFNDDDLEDMTEWVDGDDPATTGTFVDGKYQFGSFTSVANWLSFGAIVCGYSPEYPLGAFDTLDHVTFDRRYLNPDWSSKPEVLRFKYPNQWTLNCPNFRCSTCEDGKDGPLKGNWSSPLFYMGNKTEKVLIKKDNLYDDFSDHFPVIQYYRFRKPSDSVNKEHSRT